MAKKDAHKIVVYVPTTAAELAPLQREAEDDAKAVVDVVCASDADYAALDELLTEVVRRKDAVEVMRKTATEPLQQSLTTIRGWFKPTVDALKTIEASLKSAMSTYRLRKAAAEDEARRAALAAAQANNAAAMTQALTTAASVAAKPEGRAAVGFAWVVKRVAEDLLPDEYWCVDRAKLDAHAKAAGSDEPAPIPGVTFERVARVSARR